MGWAWGAFGREAFLRRATPAWQWGREHLQAEGTACAKAGPDSGNSLERSRNGKESCVLGDSGQEVQWPERRWAPPTSFSS